MLKEIVTTGDYFDLEEIFETDADPNIQDKDGITVFMDAFHGWNGDITELHLYLPMDKIKDINTRDKRGRTLLHELAQFPEGNPDYLFIQYSNYLYL